MAHKFTPEQVAYIVEHVKGISNPELLEMFNHHFGLDLKLSQIKAFKNNRRLSSGLDGRFKSGHVPFNKGMKGVTQGGVETQFKKGQKPFNFKPVGSERIDRDGYTVVKISDKGDWHHRWRHKHKVIWEKVNGPIPKGHCLIFLDGNKQNVTLENLMLITRKQLARLNQNHLIFDDPDLTRTGIILADLYGKIGERKRAK